MGSVASLSAGLMYSLKYLGLRKTLREIVRRVFGVRYTISGIEIDSDEAFRVFRSLVSKGYKIGKLDNIVYVEDKRKRFRFVAPGLVWLSVLTEDFEALYKADFRGKVVLDVGGYLGETALFFLRSGASKVVVYEPLYYEVARLNVKLNNAEDRVTVYPEGIWWFSGEVCLGGSLEDVGLTTGNRCVKVTPLHEAIRKEEPDIVKMDCEGCEYSILRSPDDFLQRPGEYIIEVHGPEPPIIERMKELGYKPKLVKRLEKMIVVYRFIKKAKI